MKRKQLVGFGYCPHCCTNLLPFNGGFWTTLYENDFGAYCGQCQFLVAFKIVKKMPSKRYWESPHTKGAGI